MNEYTYNIIIINIIIGSSIIQYQYSYTHEKKELNKIQYNTNSSDTV